MNYTSTNDDKQGRTPGSAMNMSQIRCVVMGAIGALFLNNLMISTTHTHRIAMSQANVSDLPADFHSKSHQLRSKENSSLDEGRQVLVDDDSNSSRLRNPRTLMGIFSSDNMFDATHRKWHRHLFNDVWKDERVCTLNQFRNSNDVSFKKKCELIITFVTAATDAPDAPTERLEETDTVDTPIEFLGDIKNPLKEDINWDDVTHLNIRDNMNDGKSQTWFYFGSKMAKLFEKTETPIDYVVKFDSDSILKLHDFLEFAHTKLPPPPYNKNIFAGALRDKGPWYFKDSKLGHVQSDMARYESHWGIEYDGVHLYLAGQCYLMSVDLAAFVAEEAPFSKMRVAKGGYLEGHEDHDIAAMVYHNPSPITLITIGKSQRFWEHPVKGAPRYNKIVKRETARVNRKPFEGKILKLY
mmetsp:Transcript_9662/g.20936  ORF Transcript_9662/g.20936 Transcript_9662/m.20936 type:complete len:411 (+) Transcript_9662:226-1458(+)